MARSLQQQIDDNDAAIARAESSQMYTIRGRTQQNGLLQTLYAERDRLGRLGEYASATGGVMASIGVQVRPS